MTKPTRTSAGLSSVFVTVNGARIEAEARPDLGKGLYAAWIEAGDGDESRYYRVDPKADWPVPVDVTAQVAADLAARQRRADARLEREQREGEARLRRASGETLKDARSRHGDVVEEHSDKAGVKRLRSRSPIQYLHAKDLLTGRQFSSGQAMHEDHLLSLMVRQPSENGGGGGYENGGAGACFESAALQAADRIDRVRACCDQLDGRLWPVVRAVVLEERTATEIARSKLSKDRRAILTALRSGLDVAGDCYGMRSDYSVTEVYVDAFEVPLELTQDYSETPGKHAELWRSRSLNGRSWIVEARTATEVYALARSEIARRVAERLGPGRHPSTAIGAALDADRKAALQAKGLMLRAASKADEDRIKAAEVERARVVRR